jgi:tRNA-(ms[2]io[6]A)-hydroxylase
VIAIVPTTDAWVAAALADLERAGSRVLLDHAHCEKKAAAMALRHVERHAGWPRLAERLSRLAREELVHFERVLGELRARGADFRPLPGAGYGAALLAAVRPAGPPRRGGPPSSLGDRTIDEMLCCALIEARSHERFVRLVAALAGTRLGDLYADLCDAEARHGDLYLDLALESAGAPVDDRLAELAAHEARVVARPGLPLRMHAGPPA